MTVKPVRLTDVDLMLTDQDRHIIQWVAARKAFREVGWAAEHAAEWGRVRLETLARIKSMAKGVPV